MEHEEIGYFVKLDMERLPKSKESMLKHARALNIASELLSFCGLISLRAVPDNQGGSTVYRVKELPQDIPQAGIHWKDASDTVTILHEPRHWWKE